MGWSYGYVAVIFIGIIVLFSIDGCFRKRRKRRRQQQKSAVVDHATLPQWNEPSVPVQWPLPVARANVGNVVSTRDGHGDRNVVGYYWAGDTSSGGYASDGGGGGGGDSGSGGGGGGDGGGGSGGGGCGGGGCGGG